MLIKNCSMVIFYRVLIFPADTHTSFYANDKLQQCNLLSCAYVSLMIALGCCRLIIHCSKVIFYYMLIIPADSNMLLYADYILQQCNILLCANTCISLLIVIRCSLFIMNCSKVIFIVCLYFPADSHGLLYANLELQQGKTLLCANISLMRALRCCMLMINYSKVIFYCANISLLKAICCFMLIIYCSKVPYILCANHKLQQCNLSLCAYIFLLIALVQCMLITNCSKVIIFHMLIFPC